MPFVNHVVVVLADDDRDHAVLFQRVLAQVDRDKTLTVVHSGEELLDLLSRVVPGLLFLDLNMPGISGLDCLLAIRKNPAWKALKVVVYSSSTRMSDIRQCYIHEADLYMVKPFNSAQLKNALGLVLQEEVWQAATLKNHYYINNRLVPFTAHL